MKVTQKRMSTVIDGMLVSFISNNVLAPYDGSGTPAGIAQKCRELIVQNDPEQPAETIAVCELVLAGSCELLVDSEISSLGGEVGASATAGYLTSGATPTLARVTPRAWSDITPQSAGLVSAILTLN